MQESNYPTKERIEHAIEQAKREYSPSRELSLVITKLEEALLWLSKTEVILDEEKQI